MKLSEIRIIDLAERAYFELQSSLEKFKLLENNSNNTLYSNFIENEKLNLKLLIVGEIYYPLYLHSAPVANYIKGEYISIPGKYIGEDNQRQIFETSQGITKFPIDKDLGDGRIDFLNFNTNTDQNHFLSILNLKFSDWNINITNVYS